MSGYYSRFSLTQDDYSKSHVSKVKKLITHFYVKQISLEEFNNMERAILDADEWGREVQ